MAKIYSHTVSVIKGSNKVYGCSESDCDMARVGSYFRTKRSLIVYQIIKVNPIFPIYDFEVINSKQIRINEDTRRRFLKDDILDLSYKEYELASIFEILNKGSKYKVDDIIKPKDGVASYNINEGMRFPAEVVINEIDEDGGIRQIGLKNNGKYLIPPPTDCEFKGGAGEGAKLKCDFELLNQRQIIERTIYLIDHKEDYTDIFLDYPVPDGLKEGKLSVKKTELILDKEYQGETDISADYEITNDSTPNIHLPLLTPRGIQSDVLTNQAFMMLDAKIKELEDKINKLSKI